MALKTWIIEVRADFDGKSKEALATKLVRSHAKALITSMQLIADKRKPDIAIQSDDMFEGRETIELFEDGELDNGLDGSPEGSGT
jgi:hypothetical protein